MHFFLLTTREVARVIGVHESTVKRWCNDGHLDFEKTSGGHRRIRLNALLDCTERLDIPHPLRFLNSEAVPAWEAFQAIQKKASYQLAAQMVLGWYRVNSLQKSYRFIEYLITQGIPLAALLDNIFGKILLTLGTEWQEGQISIGDEHLIYHGIRNTLELLDSKEAVVSSGAKVALVGCINGSRHEAGSLMVRSVLREHGWEVLYLGAAVPHEEFAYMQLKKHASLVCISVPLPHTLPDIKSLVRQLSAHYNPESPYRLVFGGGGISEKVTNEFIGEQKIFSRLTPFSDWLNQEVEGKAHA